MNKNYITITYKGLPINIKCSKLIVEDKNIHIYYNNSEDSKYLTNFLDELDIKFIITCISGYVRVIISKSNLIIGNKNNIKDDDELYRSIQAIRSTENLIICLKNQMHDNLSLIRTIIDNVNKLQDSAAVDSAMDIQRTLQLIHANVNHLEQRMFFAKSDINKKVLLSSKFNRHDFEVLVCIHVFIKNKPTPSSEFKCFANIDCYTDKSVIDEINSIHPSIMDSLKFCADIFLENNPEALEEAKKLILEW